MKKTFLDNVSNAKTFLIYGNVLDEYCTPDLCLRTFDEYLVKLLFSRGYKRVIFYGSDGTKGEYVLDPISARYFYNKENEEIPLSEFDVNISDQAVFLMPIAPKKSRKKVQHKLPRYRQIFPAGDLQTRGLPPIWPDNIPASAIKTYRRQ